MSKRQKFREMVLMEKHRPTLSDIAKILGVDRATVKRWRRVLEEDGLHFEKFIPGRPKKDKA